MKKVLLTVVTWFFVIMCAAVAQAELYFICHQGVPAEILTKKEIKNIFLANQTSWKKNAGIVFVNQNRKNIFKEFTKTYLDMSPSRYKTYFRKKMFTGLGQRPISFDDDQEVIDYVSNTDGAIGYISTRTDAVRSNVKMLVIKEGS